MHRSLVRQCGFLLLWMIFGCATLPAQQTDLSAAPDETVKVVMALYGGLHHKSSEFVDVSDKVSKLLQVSPQGFDVAPEVLLDQSAPKFSRTILIVYNYEQRRFFYFIPDHGAMVSSDKLIQLAKAHPSLAQAIPPTSGSDPSFKVQFATYGVSDRYVDSTEKIEQLLHDSPEGFFAHEDVMGGNPKFGSCKCLVIIFDVNGERHFFSQINLDPQITKDVILTGHNGTPPQPPQPSLNAPTRTSTSSSFANTSWVSVEESNGAFSNITFAADGSFSEEWSNRHIKGSWVANADNTEITVTHTDGKVQHFVYTANNTLVRDLYNTIFKPAGGAAPVTAIDDAPPAPDRQAPTVKLTEDQARAVVLITGDNAEGTGFIIKTPDGLAVVTNVHVIANNPNLKVTTNTGALVKVLSMKAASDRDLALLAIADGNDSYLEMAPDISSVVQPGDEVITPGNSQGGEVMLNTDGKILGIGPVRIEFSNPVYHGNSGGPVFHPKSGKVLGVVTEAVKVDTSDEIDKASFANRNSAIAGTMRYFGLRLDSVSAWVPIDSRRLQNETAFLDQFNLRSRCLDCYLNAPNDDKPEDTLWRSDSDIVKSNNEFFQQSAGADTSQQMNANRIMWAEFNDIARTDMDAIQTPANFYSFNLQRAKDEGAYRKAIQAELKEINNDVSRLGALPRSNH